MKFIGEFFSKVFAFLLIAYLASLLLTTDKCTKVHRSSLPVIYSFRLASLLSENWITQDTKIWMLKTQIESAIFVERLFEKTFTEVNKDRNGEVVYTCNPIVEGSPK